MNCKRSQILVLAVSAIFCLGVTSALSLASLDNKWQHHKEPLSADQMMMHKRRVDPSDPRALFSAIYSNYGYRKRMANPPRVAIEQQQEPAAMDDEVMEYREPEPVRYYAPRLQTSPLTKRRGLRDPLDPFNLYRAIYGY